MSDVPPPSPSLTESSPESPDQGNAESPKVTPLRCLVGAVLAGGLGYLLYRMTSAIALSFATHKVQSTSLPVQRISAAVRTLVVGMATMGTGVFALAAFGLLALALQLWLQQRRSTPETPNH